jgi:hypothetical protein
MLNKQAKFYSSIAQTPRYPREYFRVGFYGRGHLPHLANKQYIYRGTELERIRSETHRVRVCNCICVCQCACM